MLLQMIEELIVAYERESAGITIKLFTMERSSVSVEVSHVFRVLVEQLPKPIVFFQPELPGRRARVRHSLRQIRNT